MKREDYINSSATVRVLEKSLLRREQILRMAEAEDYDEFFRLLNETVYSEEISKQQDKNNIDDVLDNALQNSYTAINKISEDKVIGLFNSLQYSYHNLKVLAKEYITGEDFSDMLWDMYDELDIQQIRNELSKSDLETKTNNRYSEVIRLALKDYEENKDPQRVDMIIERAYYDHMKEIGNRSDSKILSQYVKDNIDHYNFKLVSRGHKQGKRIDFVDEFFIPGGNIKTDKFSQLYNEEIEDIVEGLKASPISHYLELGLKNYEKTGRIAEFETALLDYRMDVVRGAKTVTYGPEVLFAYLVAKETEIANLRIISTAKSTNMPSKEIIGRLRETYV
ncbi:MAG: V-type ATP synthase subunit C [Tissierellia bacterium]|nr:V-type ATP synthase subunit C [Tissierellia bacterium]